MTPFSLGMTSCLRSLRKMSQKRLLLRFYLPVPSSPLPQPLVLSGSFSKRLWVFSKKCPSPVFSGYPMDSAVCRGPFWHLAAAERNVFNLCDRYGCGGSLGVVFSHLPE